MKRDGDERSLSLELATQKKRALTTMPTFPPKMHLSLRIFLHEMILAKSHGSLITFFGNFNSLSIVKIYNYPPL